MAAAAAFHPMCSRASALSLQTGSRPEHTTCTRPAASVGPTPAVGLSAHASVGATLAVGLSARASSTCGVTWHPHLVSAGWTPAGWQRPAVPHPQSAASQNSSRTSGGWGQPSASWAGAGPPSSGRARARACRWPSEGSSRTNSDREDTARGGEQSNWAAQVWAHGGTHTANPIRQRSTQAHCCCCCCRPSRRLAGSAGS
jgi:hypothetical protein